MSGTYGPADEREAIATIHAAIDAGFSEVAGDRYAAPQMQQLDSER
ncbi:hypothetical protein ACWZHB_12385 [Nocardia sp. FBN12]